jgi:hypothetical protein
VLEREDIYQRVWGYTMVRGDRSVDVFVRKLRQKLERLSPAWRYVHTHFGVGYRFAAEPTDAASGDGSAAPAIPSAQPSARAAASSAFGAEPDVTPDQPGDPAARQSVSSAAPPVPCGPAPAVVPSRDGPKLVTIR